MGELGSIFADEPTNEAARGPDLRVRVQVPRDALGNPDGWWAPVPETLDRGDGTMVQRAVAPGEEGRGVPLHLPGDFRSGAVLRLRRQGGREADELPGDLYVTVEVVEPPPRRIPIGALVAVAVTTALAGGLVWWLVG